MDSRHRVDRMLSFSPVVRIGTSPPLSHASECVPHPLFWLKERGQGSPNPDEETYTLEL